MWSAQLPSVFVEYELPLLNTTVSLLNLIVFCVVLASGIALAAIIPRRLTASITRAIIDFEIRLREKKTDRKLDWGEKQQIAKQTRYNLKKTLEPPMVRFIGITILLPYLIIAIHALGYDLLTPIPVLGYTFTIRSLGLFVIVVLIFVLFVKSVLTPLCRAIVQAVVGSSMETGEVRDLTTTVTRVLYYLTILVGTILALDIAFENFDKLPFFETYIDPILSIVWSVLSIILVTIVVLTYFKIKIVRPRRMDKHVATSLENLIRVIAFIVGLGMIFSVLGVDVTTIVAVLGVIGFAIAFGMQHAIANLMAGFMLTVDKPFMIGDRIRVGEPGRETWGDVVDIGLNTTKIKTVEEEIVVIPNSYLTMNDIWNFTRGSPIIAHVIDIAISYGSDWRLAKKLCQEAAADHPLVLDRPEPFVRVDSFGSSGVNLKLWIWIRNARDKDQIRSDLLEEIKDRFDANGVEIPFNYHTIVFKKDIATEQRLGTDMPFQNAKYYPSTEHGVSPIRQSKPANYLPARMVKEGDVRILTPVSSILTAANLADYSVDLAQQNGGNVTALYVTKEYTEKSERRGLEALAHFEQAGARSGVPVATMIEVGEVVEMVLRTIEDRRIDMVVVGTSHHGRRRGLFSEGITEQIIEHSPVPVITIPETAKKVFKKC